jgi:hypothetical protein
MISRVMTGCGAMSAHKASLSTARVLCGMVRAGILLGNGDGILLYSMYIFLFELLQIQAWLCLFKQESPAVPNASMFSSDNASYSWYYTVTFWAPWWAEQVYMVFPAEGILVMNSCRQLHISPCYEYQ